jgi:hypothetical protein
MQLQACQYQNHIKRRRARQGKEDYGTRERGQRTRETNLFDTEADSNKLRCTPHKTVLLDATDSGLHGGKVGLIICIAGLVSCIMQLDPDEARRTPRLDVQSDNGLGGGLRTLGLLLLAVLFETLLADLGSLLVLLLVVAAEQVDIVVLLLGRRGLGGVQGGSNNFWAVDGVGLGRVTGEGSKVIVEAGDVLVPTRGVGVLGRSRGLLECLEDGNICLGRRVSV